MYVMCVFSGAEVYVEIWSMLMECDNVGIFLWCVL
jgi:hypothetical protein